MKSDEHRKLTAEQTAFLSEIDALNTQLNEDYAVWKENQKSITQSQKRYVMEEVDSTAFKFPQTSAFDFSVYQPTATRTYKNSVVYGNALVRRNVLN